VSDLLAEIEAGDELAELRAANHRLQRKLKRRADQREEWREAVYQASRDAALTQGPPQYVAPPKDRRKAGEEVALLHLTDWQNGKLTPSYNMETCRARVLRAVHKTIKLTDYHRLAFPVKRIAVLLGGDMLENVATFPGQAFEVEAGVFEQVWHTVGIIRDSLATLAGHFENVDVYWAIGNHGRIARKGDHPREDNWDRFIYSIAGEQHPPNVTWHPTVGWHKLVVIGNYRALLTHGDLVGDAPKTIQDKVNKWASGVTEPFGDIYIGHRHHVKVLEMPAGGRIFLTASTESGSDYASGQIGADGPPTQRLNFVSPSRGRVTAEYLLEVE
jgi:hypothetical protein